VKYGATALLAHNSQSGALFINLSPGQEMDIILGDGAIQRYGVATVRHLPALSPMDIYLFCWRCGGGGAGLRFRTLGACAAG
jgi:hypothetical protein